MKEFNAGKPVDQHRELLFYRLLAPLSREAPNSHVLVHAFESDRNGLLMAGNHNGIGFTLGKAVTMSCSFFVHVNADQAVMEFCHESGDGWWVQEVSFPRMAAGRTTITSKIWSPQGTHVATAHQDGICRPAAASKVRL